MARNDFSTEPSETTTRFEPEPLLDDELIADTGAQSNPAVGLSGEDGPASGVPQTFNVTDTDAGMRLDQYLVSQLPEVSRVRVQQLIEQGKVTVNDRPTKASLRLKGTEQIAIIGELLRPPLKALPEDIPLDVVYEDDDLAVVSKPAGMVVHAGAGSSEDARNRGTLVNALLFRFNKLSKLGGDLRPGIVHRLDKDTSGLIVVAKNDRAHRRLADQFASRKIHKRYVALVHNWPATDQGTVRAPIARDPQNRTRMTTRDPYGREAVSHYKVLERFASPYGRFALIEVKIETGRTHQIRVHMGSIGHPVVGDTLYGAPSALSPHSLDRERQGNPVSLRHLANRKPSAAGATLMLARNFLHAASLELTHPRTGEPLSFRSELPQELVEYMRRLHPPEERKTAETAPTADLTAVLPEPKKSESRMQVKRASAAPKRTAPKKSSAKRMSSKKTASTKVHGTKGTKKVSVTASKRASNKGKQPKRADSGSVTPSVSRGSKALVPRDAQIPRVRSKTSKTLAKAAPKKVRAGAKAASVRGKAAKPRNSGRKA